MTSMVTIRMHICKTVTFSVKQNMINKILSIVEMTGTMNNQRSVWTEYFFSIESEDEIGNKRVLQ